MYSILTAVIPTFVVIALGFLSVQMKLFGHESASILSRFVYYFAVPCVLFLGVATSPFDQVTNMPFILSFGIGGGIVFFLTLIFSKDLSFGSMRALNFMSSNTVYMGIPILSVILGKEIIVPVAVSTMMMIVFLLVSVLIVEIIRQKSAPEHGKSFYFVSKLFRIVSMNPLVFSTFLGVAVSYWQIKIPSSVNEALKMLQDSAVAVALFAIGQSLSFQFVSTHLKEVSISLLVKLILHPLIVFGFLYWFGASPFLTIAGTMLAAMPSANIAFVICDQYKIYEKESSAVIFMTTIFSLISLPVILYACRLVYPVL